MFGITLTIFPTFGKHSRRRAIEVPARIDTSTLLFADFPAAATSLSCWGLHAATIVSDCAKSDSRLSASAIDVSAESFLPVSSLPHEHATSAADTLPLAKIPWIIAPAILPAPMKPNFFILLCD